MRRKSICLLVLLVTCNMLAGTVFAKEEGSRLGLFIYGLSGAGSFKKSFHDSWDKLTAMLKANDYRSGQLVKFSERPDEDSSVQLDQLNSAKNLQMYFEGLAKRETPFDDVFVFVAGHANGQGRQAKFHIRGIDVTYGELIEWIDQIPAKRMVLIIATSQGATWIENLGKENRVIIVGNGLKEFDMLPRIFLEKFPEVFHEPGDGESTRRRSEVTLRDAFLRTQFEILRWYDHQMLHNTEIAQIDEDGDGVGNDYLELIKKLRIQVDKKKMEHNKEKPREDFDSGQSFVEELSLVNEGNEKGLDLSKADSGMMAFKTVSVIETGEDDDREESDI